MSLYWNNWSPILTSRYPSKGLRNYGFGITGKGIIAIYGGLTEIGINLRKQRNWKIHEGLWIFNTTASESEFYLVDLDIDTNGGFSRIFPMGGEILGILNPYFEKELLILNFAQFKFYKVKIIQMENTLNRTAFALIPNVRGATLAYASPETIHSLVKKVKD